MNIRILKRNIIFLVCFVLVIVFTLLSLPSLAAIIVVDNIEDNQVVDWKCTLREALGNANSDGVGDCAQGNGDDVIDLRGLIGTISLNSQLEFYSNVKLLGPGAETLVLSNDGSGRVIKVSGVYVTVEIEGVKITGGGTSSGGGGVFNELSALTLTNSIISENSVYSSNGGGISNQEGTLTLINSTVSGNSSSSVWYENSCGGGISNNDGIVTLINSTVSGNSALFNGGGIWNSPRYYKKGHVTLINSTVSGNLAEFGEGGGIWTRNSPVTLINSTVSDNSSEREGGGIFNEGSNLTLTNTLIVNNVGEDCFSHDSLGGVIGFSDAVTSTDIISITNTLIEDGSCGATLTGDPRLAPLADNGGYTKTHALLLDSPAIDAGNSDFCPETDQRGLYRVDMGCDIGAFEVIMDEDDTSDDTEELPSQSNDIEGFLQPNQLLIDNFAMKYLPLTSKLTVKIVGIGSVTSNPYGIDVSNDGSSNCTYRSDFLLHCLYNATNSMFYFPTGTWVELMTEPDKGFKFIGWGGDEDCIDEKLFMGSSKTCVAYFSAIEE